MAREEVKSYIDIGNFWVEQDQKMWPSGKNEGETYLRHEKSVCRGTMTRETQKWSGDVDKDSVVSVSQECGSWWEGAMVI